MNKFRLQFPGNVKCWVLTFILICGTSMFTACSDDDDATVIEPEETQQLADYTIIYYGHGGGNLDACLVSDMIEFYGADDDCYKNVNVCALYKYSAANNITEDLETYSNITDYTDFLKKLLPYAGKSVRYVIDDKIDKSFLESDDEDIAIVPGITDVYGDDNADITNPDSLTNFINWAASVRPAKKYILILSDHGGGYQPDGELSENVSAARTRGVIYDCGNNDKHFTAMTLAQAIKAAKVRPACIYLDACLMNCIEYQFELAPFCDYLALSTFLVPGQGGDYSALINILSQNPDNLENALSTYVKTVIDNWDKEAEEYQKEEVYHDMTITCTANLDAFGRELRAFTDRLIAAYQSGDAEVKAKIDKCTAGAYKVEMQRPNYDLFQYMLSLCEQLPELSTEALWEASYKSVVYEQSSKWLHENGLPVGYSILLGCQGHYCYNSGKLQVFYNADGTCEYMSNGTLKPDSPWGSTLDDTYGQLRFDQITGWSRWIKLNEQQPNLDCFSGYNPFATFITSEK